jgi:hypothetical protein
MGMNGDEPLPDWTASGAPGVRAEDRIMILPLSNPSLIATAAPPGGVLPAATHLLHVQNPREMAERLAAFFSRHPIAAA